MTATRAPALIVVRHGETEWSRSGQHTGLTDIPLTDAGRHQAVDAGRMIRALLGSTRPARVFSSPRRRAMDTANLAGFPPDEVTEDAGEWGYGDYEGQTSKEIHGVDPDWSLWDSATPNGETAAQVQARIDELIGRVRQLHGPAVLFSHGHASRCVAARWLGQPVTNGRFYWLGTGAVSSLGYEHDLPVILRWNMDLSVAGE